MPEDEEVLGDEEALQDEEERDESADDGWIGGMMNSLVVRVLVGAIALVAIVLMTIFITNWAIEEKLAGTQVPAKGQVTAENPQQSQRAPMDTIKLDQDFIITKQDPRTGRLRTLKVQIVIAFNDANTAVKSEIQQRKPQIRDLIYQVLGNKNVEELGYDNKRNLQDELVAEINKLLTGGHRIQEVYFTSIVFQ